jgi:hypothetical protein
MSMDTIEIADVVLVRTREFKQPITGLRMTE